jgi:hypothetical protein
LLNTGRRPPREKEENLTAEDLARQKPQPNSEYLAQRRKGRKEIKLPDLAFLASWREQIAVLDSHWPPENLRKSRKLSKIAVQRSHRKNYVFFVVAKLKANLTRKEPNVNGKKPSFNRGARKGRTSNECVEVG